MLVDGDAPRIGFRPHSVLMGMEVVEFMAEAVMVNRFLKGALTRSRLPQDPIIGYEDPDFMEEDRVPRFFRWNFERPENVEFVEQLFIPCGRALLHVAEKRGIDGVKQLFGPQVLYALQKGTLSRWSFNEISDILFPVPDRVVSFAAAAARRASHVQQAAILGVLAPDTGPGAVLAPLPA